jgi:hypothetical protein
LGLLVSRKVTQPYIYTEHARRTHEYLCEIKKEEGRTKERVGGRGRVEDEGERGIIRRENMGYLKERVKFYTGTAEINFPEHVTMLCECIARQIGNSF